MTLYYTIDGKTYLVDVDMFEVELVADYTFASPKVEYVAGRSHARFTIWYGNDFQYGAKHEATIASSENPLAMLEAAITQIIKELP